jgi:hypothetical protein
VTLRALHKIWLSVQQRQKTCESVNDNYSSSCSWTYCKAWKYDTKTIQGQYLIIISIIWQFTSEDNKIPWHFRPKRKAMPKNFGQKMKPMQGDVRQRWVVTAQPQCGKKSERDTFSHSFIHSFIHSFTLHQQRVISAISMEKFWKRLQYKTVTDTLRYVDKSDYITNSYSISRESIQ